MVKFVFIIKFLVICVFSVNGQPFLCDSIYEEFTTFSFISNPPYYLNGEKSENDSLLNFIKNNLKLPDSALKEGIEGTVYVQFWIDVDGQTKEHEIIKGVREDIDEEALRVVRLIKFEKPAMQRGKPIKVQYIVPVNFNYNEKVSFKKRMRQK